MRGQQPAPQRQLRGRGAACTRLDADHVSRKKTRPRVPGARMCVHHAWSAVSGEEFGKRLLGAHRGRLSWGRLRCAVCERKRVKTALEMKILIHHPFLTRPLTDRSPREPRPDRLRPDRGPPSFPFSGSRWCLRVSSFRDRQEVETEMCNENLSISVLLGGTTLSFEMNLSPAYGKMVSPAFSVGGSFLTPGPMRGVAPPRAEPRDLAARWDGSVSAGCRTVTFVGARRPSGRTFSGAPRGRSGSVEGRNVPVARNSGS